jgi:hypothetical protein
VRLRDVLRPRKTTIDYLYDFDDCWEHRLTVTNIRNGDPRSLLSPVRRWRAQRAARGLWRHSWFFNQTLDAAVDPKHPNHAEAKKWLDDYDPNAFDELPIKYALSRIANQRNAAKVRLAKKNHPQLRTDQSLISPCYIGPRPSPDEYYSASIPSRLAPSRSVK